MSSHPNYVKGDWKAICDICGRVYLGSQLRKRWDGFMACPDDWEPRQPQDFVRGIVDTQVPPYVRPESNDSFIAFCTPENSSSIADWGVADCLIADRPFPTWWANVPFSTFTEQLPLNIYATPLDEAGEDEDQQSTPDLFIYGCSPEGMSCIPGLAIPGCSIPGFIPIVILAEGPLDVQ